MGKILNGKFLFYINNHSMFKSVLYKRNWFYNFLTRFENWKIDLHNGNSQEEMFKFYLQMYLKSVLWKYCIYLICKLHSTGVCLLILSELRIEFKIASGNLDTNIFIFASLEFALWEFHKY